MRVLLVMGLVLLAAVGLILYRDLREQRLTQEELLSALPHYYAQHEVELFWTQSRPGNILGYRVYRRTAGDWYKPLLPEGIVVLPKHYRDRTAIPGVPYSYAVTSVHKDGRESDHSKPSEVTIPAN